MMFQPLLDQTLQAMYSLMVVDRDPSKAARPRPRRFPWPGTLVFQTQGGRHFQLLVRQNWASLRQIREHRELTVDAGIDIDHRAPLEPLECGARSQPPFLLRRIREYWAREANDQFLVGVSLEDPENAKHLCLLLGADEIDPVDPSTLADFLESGLSPFHVITLTHACPP